MRKTLLTLQNRILKTTPYITWTAVLINLILFYLRTPNTTYIDKSNIICAIVCLAYHFPAIRQHNPLDNSTNKET